MSSKDFREKDVLDQSEGKGRDEKGKDIWSRHFHWYHSWDEPPKDYAGCKAVDKVSKDGSNADQRLVSAIELLQKWQAVRYQKRLRKSQTTKALEELLHKSDDAEVPLFHPPSHADRANESNQQSRETFTSHVSQLAWVYRDLSDPPTHSCPNTKLSQLESELNEVMQTIPLCEAHEPRLTAINCANSSEDLVPSKKFDEDTGDDEWLEHTNLDLLYEKRPMQHHSEVNDKNHHDVSMSPVAMYDAKHPSLAPLIAVMRSKQETYSSDSTYPSAGPEIISVFDVTPERYTSLHILLRRSGFLTSSLLPGRSTGSFANDDEGDDICRCRKTRKNTRLSPLSSSSNRKLYRVGTSPRAHIVDIRARFILLQLFHVTQYLHSNGIALGQALRPDRIFVQNDGWIRLAIPISQQRPKNDQAPDVNSMDTVTATVPTDLHSDNNDTIQILPYPGYGAPPTLQWQNRSISNFEYILYLNKAAGRSLGDPHHPPIFPWVTDFTQEILDPDHVYSIPNPGNGWRDLSRSKFRLQKGDEQLDHTFRHATPPHHIPESISDLTYTVYRARCTPVSTLCSVVRETFVPEHYPDGVMKLFQWTPDEATAEFYMTPSTGSIFESKHKNKGMPDLELPPWCDGSVHEFIKYHRRLLESDFVSHWLHLWIDVNFGEALSGKKAVEAKNVVLSCHSWESETLLSHSESLETCDGGCQPKLLISKKVNQPAECRDTTNIHWETLIHSTKDSTILLGDSSGDGSPRQHRTGFIQLFCKAHPSRGDTTNKWWSQEDITSNISSEESDVCQYSPIINNGEDNAPALTLLDRDCELREVTFEAMQKIDMYSLGMIAMQLYHSGRTIPSPSVQSMIEELLDGSSNLPDYLNHGQDTEDTPSKAFSSFCLENTYDTLAAIQNISIDVQATDYHRSSALDKVQRCFDQWIAIPNVQRIVFNCELGLLLPVVAESLSNVSPFEENERLNAESSSCVSRKLCDFLFIIGNNIGNDGSSAFLLPKVIALLVTAFEIDNEDSLKFIQRMLLSRLIPTLYKISSGSAFLRELVPLLIKLLYVRPQKLKIHSKDSNKILDHQNSVKKAVAVCLTILAQDDVCGRALCCRYIVPQLVSKLGDLRIYDISHYTDQIFHEASLSLTKNPVASALVGVMLFLPEESIGMLICQPILSTFLESMLAGQLSKNATTTLSDKVRHILASAEMIAVLRSCVPNLDPETAERYFFSKSSSSLKNLLEVSLNVAASKTKLTRCQDFRSSEHRTGKCVICKLASQSTNPSFNSKQDPYKEFCHVSIVLTSVKRGLLSEMGGLICSLGQMIKTKRFSSILYPIIENYFANIIRIHKKALRRNVKDMVNGVSSADESFTRALRLPGISVAKTLFTFFPDAEAFCPSIGKLWLWLNHSDSMNARLSIREALANRDVLSATGEESGPVFQADSWLSDTDFPSSPRIDSTVTTTSEYSLLEDDTEDDYGDNIPGIPYVASEQGTSLSRTEDSITSTMEELHAMPFFQISQETEGPGVPLSSRSLDVGTDPGWYENSSFDTDSSNDLYDDTTPESPQLANERRERNFPAWDRSDRESIEKRREDWAWTLGLRPQWTDPWLRIGSYWSSRLVMISSLQANGAPTHKVRNKLQANMRQSDCFGIQSLAVNSSESILASGNRRGEVCLWDLRQHPPKITTRLVNELKGRAHQLGKTQTKGMFGPISQIQFSAPISQLEFLERERTGIACDGLLNLWDVEMGCVVSSMNSGVLQTDRNEIGQFLDSWIGLSQPTTKDPFLAFSLVRSGNCMGSDSSCSQEILAVTQSNLFRIDMRCGQRSIQSPLLCSVTKEITMPNSMWLSRSWMLNSPEISPRGLGGDSAPSSNTQSPADYHFSCISPADFCDWVCVGSLSGHVHCFERRAGRLLHCWKAHEKAIIAIKSISNHQVLTIGRDRKATLWDLRGDSPVKLQRFRDLPGGGSGLSMQNVAVQNFVHKGIKSQGSPIGNSSDNPLSMLYAVSGNRSVSVPIPDIATPQKSVKLKAKSLRHASGAKKKSFRKLDIRSIALLPLRQLVLLGDDDGTIHVCV